MEEVMRLNSDRQYFERYLWFYGESAIISIFVRNGIDILFLLKLRKDGLTMMLKGAKMARLGRSMAPFFQRVKSCFMQFITNQLPETGCIMPWLWLFAFAGRMVV